jgi:hypothetical protein
MRNRIYRYNQPEDNTLVDILNYTNKSDYTVAQLSFGDPIEQGHVHTHILVKDARAPTFDGAITLQYSRYDLASTFSENPLVIDVGDVSDAALFNGIFEQQRVMFEHSGIEIVRTPLAAAISNNILDGIGFVSVTDPDAVPDLPEVDHDGNYNFTVRAKPGSKIWVGQTSLLVRPTAMLLERSIGVNLAVRQYLTETRDSKTPIELVYDIDTDAQVHGETFAKKFKTGDIITQVSPFLEIARVLTRDNWIASTTKSNFNLQGSKVLYNGYNVGDFATDSDDASHIIVIELGDLCRNLKGIWTIQYKDPTVFKYDLCRVDLDSQPDIL